MIAYIIYYTIVIIIYDMFTSWCVEYDIYIHNIYEVRTKTYMTNAHNTKGHTHVAYLTYAHNTHATCMYI